MSLSPRREVLPNGAVFIGKETRTTPAITITLAMRAGSICDPPDAVGAMWLLSRVIDRGTSAHSAAEIADALDSRGISVTIGVSRHVLSMTCTCLSEDFESVCALLGEMLMVPSFPEHEIATRKSEIITSIRQDEDNPAVRATEGLMALLYGEGHPYGRPTKGSIEMVERLTREAIVRLHQSRFASSELTAIIVGDVQPDRACDVVSGVLGGWKSLHAAPIRLASPPRPTNRRRQVISMMNKPQADVAYGFTTIRRVDSTYDAFRLMNNVLGQYALGGRLGDSIRERQGMAYYVSSAFDANVVEGPLVIRAGVSPSNVDRTIASIDYELSNLVITEKELNDSRQYLIGSLPRALETNAGIGTFLLQAELFGLGLDYDVRLPELLRRVTLDQVNAAASSLKPELATIVTAGTGIG
jgi:zinc protease